MARTSQIGGQESLRGARDVMNQHEPRNKTMKFAVLSDLHIDVHEDWPAPEICNADVLILAGDIAEGPLALEWAIEQQGRLGVPVVMVPGNHEYYRYEMLELEQQFKDMTRSTHDVHVLQCGRLDLDEHVILGCTLWTDFALDGDSTQSELAAIGLMVDYRCITIGDRLLLPADTVSIHQEHKSWLCTELQKVHAEGKTAIVVTHHGPSSRSVAAKYLRSSLNPAFVSDLSAWMMADWAPALWIHGHTHEVFDYREGRTRVVANPRGYPFEQSSTGDFDWGKVVDV